MHTQCADDLTLYWHQPGYPELPVEQRHGTEKLVRILLYKMLP